MFGVTCVLPAIILTHVVDLDSKCHQLEYFLDHIRELVLAYDIIS